MMNNNTLEYKGYLAKIEIDSDTNTLYGSLTNTRDVITFSAQTVAEVRQAFQDSVEDYLAWAAEDGFIPDKPYSGKIILRMSPALHQQISARATMDGFSLNQWITNTLQQRVLSDHP